MSEAVAVFPKKVCVSCKTSDTPLWRLGPHGPKTMCNACGIKWKRRVKGTSTASPKKRKRSESLISSLSALPPTKKRSSKGKSGGKNLTDSDLSFGPTEDEDEQLSWSPSPISSPGLVIADSPPLPSTEDRELMTSRSGIGRRSLRDRSMLTPIITEQQQGATFDYELLKGQGSLGEKDGVALMQALASSVPPSPALGSPKVKSAKKRDLDGRDPSDKAPKPKKPKRQHSAPKPKQISKAQPHVDYLDRVNYDTVAPQGSDDTFSVSFRFPVSKLHAKRAFFEYASFELERLEEEMKFDKEVTQFQEQLQALKTQLTERDAILAKLVQCLSEPGSETIPKTALLQQLPQIDRSKLSPPIDPLYQTM